MTGGGVTEGLAAATSLGDGRSIRPPLGWIAEGFVNGNDTLRLRPASIVRWTPPGVDRLSISWSKSKVMLDPETRGHFDTLLRSPFGVIKIDQLQGLFPSLLRIPLFRITFASVSAFADSGPMLEVHYFIAELREAGIIFFAPSERFQAGEIQILSYEGREPVFSQNRPLAMKCLHSFTIYGAPPESAKKTGFIRNSKKRLQTKKTGVVKLKVGADEGPLTYEYVLKEGDTIKSIVQVKWPSLSPQEQSDKVKEIYALNRARGNALYAWTIKAGDRIWLPFK